MMKNVVVVITGEYAKRLTDDQRYPHRYVGRRSGQECVDELSERNLEEHTHECPVAEHLEWYADQVLVEEGRHEEHYEGGLQLGEALVQQWLVEVAHCPRVHRYVPRLPEVFDRLGVPPIAVELAVTESHDLCHEVERRVKVPVEPYQP